MNTQKKLLSAILLAGFVAGTLDGGAAIIQYLMQGGKKPGAVFKFIASGILGKKAFAGGMDVVALGVILHYLIAILFTAFFFMIYPRLKLLQLNIFLSALIYGLFVWLMMNRVIVPLSATPPLPFNWDKAIIAMVILVVCMGLPAAFFARKYYLYKK